MLRIILKIVTSVVFIIAGLACIVLSVVMLTGPKRDLVETTGIIVDIQEENVPGEDEPEYSVFIDYEAQGEKYSSARYPMYSSSMNVGDEVVVLYDTGDSSYIESPDAKYFPLIFLVAGLISIVVGVVSFFKG